MGLLFRTSQTAKFVSVLDSHAVVPPADTQPWPGPDPDWLPAAGQPADCGRVEVRALSAAQWSEILELYASDAPSTVRRLVEMGLVSIDDQPTAFDDLAQGWGQLIANLVSDVSVVPMAGRRPRSTDGQ